MAYKKRTYKKRSRKSTAFTRYRSIKNIVPDSKIVKLRYVQQIGLDAGAGLASAHVFRANSIFDPDYSGTGHQPLGHDQWAVFYDHYNVISSKCTAQFIATGTNSSTDACMVGILLKDNISPITDPTTIMEQSNSGYSFLSGQTASSVKTIRKGYSAKQFFGLKDVKDNRSITGGNMGGNAGDDALFHVYQTALGVTDNPRSIDAIVTIEYLVQLTERKTLAQS